MVTTTKRITVQRPRFDTDGNIAEWMEEAYWDYVTPEDKTAIMSNARIAARSCGGRIVQMVTTTDDKDSADETTWDDTEATKVLVSRVVASASVTAPKDQISRALPAVQSIPGCKALAEAMAAAIA